jgi:hypothetical protein
MFKYAFLTIVAATAYFAFAFDAQLTNEMIGRIFVWGIIAALGKKAQKVPSGLSYGESVREQGDVALSVNFDPTLPTNALKIPASLYSGKDPFLEKLRAKIKEAEKIKLKARQLHRKGTVMLEKTKDELVEKNLVEEEPAKGLDDMFDIEDGVAHIVDVTVDEVKEQSYDDTPDYDILTRIAFDNSPYFSSTFKYFDSEDVLAILYRAPFMIILIGIIGTFAGFYLALGQGGDIKSGAAVAIVSSLVGLPVSLFMDYINTLYPDKARYQHAFNKYKESLEILFLHEKELSGPAKDRRMDPLRRKSPEPEVVPEPELEEQY